MSGVCREPFESNGLLSWTGNKEGSEMSSSKESKDGKEGKELLAICGTRGGIAVKIMGGPMSGTRNELCLSNGLLIWIGDKEGFEIATPKKSLAIGEGSICGGIVVELEGVRRPIPGARRELCWSNGLSCWAGDKEGLEMS